MDKIIKKVDVSSRNKKSYYNNPNSFLANMKFNFIDSIIDNLSAPIVETIVALRDIIYRSVSDDDIVVIRLWEFGHAKELQGLDRPENN